MTFYSLTGLSCFGYLNTLVSYQYEIKDARFMLEFNSEKKTANEIEAISQSIDQRENDINQSQRFAIFVGSLSFLLATGLVIVRLKKY